MFEFGVAPRKVVCPLDAAFMIQDGPNSFACVYYPLMMVIVVDYLYCNDRSSRPDWIMGRAVNVHSSCV